MNSPVTLNNKFDDNDYIVSIASVRKRISIPDPLSECFPKGTILESTRFDNIIFEAAIFRPPKKFKPFFTIELNEYGTKITKEDFTKFIHHIIVNEEIDNLINSKKVFNTYKKYGYIARRHDMWQLFLLTKTIFIFIFKDPCAT
jgi:hypothetical protein